MSHPSARGPFRMTRGTPRVVRRVGGYLHNGQWVSGHEVEQPADRLPTEEEEIDTLLNGDGGATRITAADLQGPLSGFGREVAKMGQTQGQGQSVYGSAGAGPDVTYDLPHGDGDYDTFGSGTELNEEWLPEEGESDLMGQPATNPREQYGDFLEEADGYGYRDNALADRSLEDAFDVSQDPTVGPPGSSRPREPALGAVHTVGLSNDLLRMFRGR